MEPVVVTCVRYDLRKLPAGRAPRWFSWRRGLYAWRNQAASPRSCFVIVFACAWLGSILEQNARSEPPKPAAKSTSSQPRPKAPIRQAGAPGTRGIKRTSVKPEPVNAGGSGTRPKSEDVAMSPTPPISTLPATADTASPGIPTGPPCPAPEEPKRLRIRTEDGRIVVARLHGTSGDKISVLLPDGRIGFSSGLAETDEPFQPMTADQLRESLVNDPALADFQVRQSAHYLVFFQSTPGFAEESIKLLENLYKSLSEVLRKRGFAIHEPEFPLVAIIFRTERDFRAHRRIDPDIQAYYEPLSNRITFYQKGEHDGDSPEVAALRKPQTVAHEGTHQILQNIGIQPRLAAWPLWLVEGLAEYCSPPTITRKGLAAWGGLGLVNPFHMATIHDLNDPLPVQVKGMKRAQVGRNPKTPMVEYLVTRKSLTPTDYALSWALTHYLLMKRGNDFLAFLKTMSQIPPLEDRSPEDHLASFREAFGPDLVKMDRSIASYLAKLKYDPLPYYAVMFEQPNPGGLVRRAVMVSQSPSVIRQWLESVSSPQGGPASWEFIPHPTKARALVTAEQWMQSR